MKTIALLMTLSLGIAAAQAQITSIDWGALNSNGLGKADGTELAIGDLVRIGTFNLTDAQIRDSQSNVSLLNAAFIQYDTAAIGDDVGVPAHWYQLTTQSTISLGIDGHKIYLWAFDTSSMASATQQGIFTSSNPNWSFPSDTAIPNTTSIDLQEVQSSGILVGGFGVGTSTATGAPLFNLVPIPEPGSYAACFAAMLLVLAIYRGVLSRSSPDRRAKG